MQSSAILEVVPVGRVVTPIHVENLEDAWAARRAPSRRITFGSST